MVSEHEEVDDVVLEGEISEAESMIAAYQAGGDEGE